jgi:hypothetical protein
MYFPAALKYYRPYKLQTASLTGIVRKLLSADNERSLK